MNRTLLLNATYEPITVIGWRKAITLLLLQKAEALAHYDNEIRSAQRSFQLPAVVRLQRRVPWRKPTVRFNRRHVFARDDHVCQYCGQKKPASSLTFDHVIPRCHGGKTNWTNIVTACMDCNHAKGGRTPEQASMKLRRRPFTPFWLLDSQDKVHETSLWEPYLW